MKFKFWASASKKSRIKIFKCRAFSPLTWREGVVTQLGPWLVSSCLRVTCAAGAGGDGKGKGKKSLSLAFVVPITPCVPLGRDSERRMGTNQAGTLGLYQPMLNRNFANLTLTRQKNPYETALSKKTDQFPVNDTLSIKQEGKRNPLICFQLVWSHCVNLKYICTTLELSTPNKKETAVIVAAKTQAHNF